MKKIKTLGIFDSGLGGYSVYQYLKEHLDPVSLVLYADQKNAPYGNQSDDAIIAYTLHAMKWFQDHDIRDVVIACNTVSAVALSTARNHFPDMNLIGIIELTVGQIEPNADTCVGIVSTLATFNAHAYRNFIHEKGPIHVKELALPELVNIIEGLNQNLKLDTYLENELKPILESTDLILGCTHYPLVHDAFRKIYKGQVHDSRRPICEYVAMNYEFLRSSCQTFTTGDAQKMERQIKRLFDSIEKVETI